MTYLAVTTPRSKELNKGSTILLKEGLESVLVKINDNTIVHIFCEIQVSI